MTVFPNYSWLVLAIGLLAQALFFARFFIQWLASEREKRCVVPRLFWHLSIAGSILLLIYAVARKDLVFVFIPLPNLVIYLRNLSLMEGLDVKRKTGIFSRWWLFGLLGLGMVAAVGAVAGPKLVNELRTIPWSWALVGFGGQLLWNSRFLLQLFASERAGRTLLPPSFWYVSLVGSLLLLAYAIYRQDPVFIIAMAPNAIIYLRNLYFLHREKKPGFCPSLRQGIPNAILVFFLLGWMILGFLWASEFRGRITESRRSEVAREIIEGPGKWTVPTLDGKPFLTKPPLYYDLVATSFKLFGINEGAARLPSATFSLIALLATFWAGKLWRGNRTGLLAALLMGTTVLFLQNCRLGEIDGVLLGFLSISLAMIHGALKQPCRRKWWMMGLWASMAGGFLTKGPHAVMFPLGGAILTALFMRGKSDMPLKIRSIFTVPGIVTFLIIVLPWFIFVAVTVPGTAQTFGHETLGRLPGLHQAFPSPLSGGGHLATAHQEPLWFYVEKLPALLPWLPLALIGAFYAWNRGKNQPEDRFGPAYLIAGFTMLSLVSSKKEVYLLALVPEVCLLAADVLRPTLGSPPVFSRWRRRFFWTLSILAAAALAGVLPVAVFMAQKNAPSFIKPILILLVAIGGICLVSQAICSLQQFDHPEKALFNALLAMVLALSLGFHIIKPEFDSQRSYKQFSRRLDDCIPANARIVSSSDTNYALMFYSGRLIEWHADLKDIKPGDFLLLEKRKISDLITPSQWRTVMKGTSLLPNAIRHRYLVLTLKETPVVTNH